MKRTPFRRQDPRAASLRRQQREQRAQEKLLLVGAIERLGPQPRTRHPWPSWLPRERWALYHQSEEDWQAWVEDTAVKVGHVDGRWEMWHCRNAKESTAGWPDLALFRPGAPLFLELKARSKDGSYNGPRNSQKVYLFAMAAAGLDVRVWSWPDDVEEAWATLTGKPWAECPYSKESPRHDHPTHA